MTATYKNLGQLAPDAATLSNLYTVPIGRSAVISSIVIANRDCSDTTFRLSHAIAAAADDVAQYVAWDVLVPGYTPYVFTLGVTLAATDQLRCYARNGRCSFNVYGQERS